MRHNSALIYSTSEVTTLWRHTNLFIIIIIIIYRRRAWIFYSYSPGDANVQESIHSVVSFLSVSF